MAEEKFPEGGISPESMLCFDIYATHHAVGQIYQPLLSEIGLTYPQYLVMVTLWGGDGLTVGELGARLDLESSTLTPLIKRLEAQGLLTRKRDVNDERKVRISLTSAGKALQDDAAHVRGCIIEAFGLSMEEFVDLHEKLGRLRARLKAKAA